MKFKTHLTLFVSSLSETQNFYQKLFKAEPSKTKTSFVVFSLQEPQLNLTLSLRADGTFDTVKDHFGVELLSLEKLEEERQRLTAAGIQTFFKDSSEGCTCSGSQNKFWVSDPAGNEWKFWFNPCGSQNHKH